MAKAILCDRKDEIVDGDPGSLTVRLVDCAGREIISKHELDLCGACVEMCYKIITGRLLPHLMVEEVDEQ